MNRLRSSVPALLITLVFAIAPGCKDDPPPPTAEPSASASGAARTRQPVRQPPNPTAAVNPQQMKEYRVDVCYFGTLSLKQSRDAYLASLGKDEPSEKKLPSFGVPTAPAGGTATPAASGSANAGMAAPKDEKKTATAPAKAAPDKATVSAAPKTSAGAKTADAKTPPATPKGTSEAAAKPAPATSALSPDARPDVRKPFDIAMRVPHDRNARACTVAAGLKNFAMPGVDEALAAFAPFAVELARDLTAASGYYQREEYKTDAFAKGKEYHKKLLAQFEKLDELSDKLGTEIAAWRKAHLPDAAKQDEGEKVAGEAVNLARDLMLAVLPKKIDTAVYKDKLAQFEKAAEALKTYGTANTNDNWSKYLGPSVDAFVKTAKDVESKISEKGIQSEAFFNMINGHTAIIEANYRALARSLMAKTPGGAPLELRPRMLNPQGTAAVPTPAPLPAPDQKREDR